MDGPRSKEQQPMIDDDASSSKKRKVVQSTVVRVRIEANVAKQKGEGPPPSDSWSWRKYGQKPIKGSPYPRGYYRCSTSKGFSAKKQVERCRTDASVLVITYTSNHNHPGPDLPSIIPTKPSQQDCLQAPSNEISPPKYSQDAAQQDPLTTLDELNSPSDDGDHQKINMVSFSSAPPQKSTEDIFEELEELPTSSSFAGMVRNSIFDERILLLPY